MAGLQGIIRGRDLLYCYLFPVTIESDYTITIPELDSSYNMSGYIKSVVPNINPNLSMEQSVDLTTANYLNLYDDFSLTLKEMERIDGINGTFGVIETAVFSSDYIGCQYAIRGLNTPSIVTFLGVRGDYSGPQISGFGDNNQDLVIKPTTWADMSDNPITVGNVDGIISPLWFVQGS